VALCTFSTIISGVSDCISRKYVSNYNTCFIKSTPNEKDALTLDLVVVHH